MQGWKVLHHVKIIFSSSGKFRFHYYLKEVKVYQKKLMCIALFPLQSMPNLYNIICTTSFPTPADYLLQIVGLQNGGLVHL
jgi:hypothetical protein